MSRRTQCSCYKERIFNLELPFKSYDRHHYSSKIDLFGVISIITLRQRCLEMLSTLYLINVSSGARRVPTAETKCLLAARSASERIALVIINILTT